jgi:hypothetical protein|tara:strand:- start:196 stop:345 length:150 start_codon:yes stop_codon:yes gene_type:complete
MNGKGDKSRITNYTKYRKNYTKIFGEWIKNTTTEVQLDKKRKVEKKSKA